MSGSLDPDLFDAFPAVPTEPPLSTSLSESVSGSGSRFGTGAGYVYAHGHDYSYGQGQGPQDGPGSPPPPTPPSKSPILSAHSSPPRYQQYQQQYAPVPPAPPSPSSKNSSLRSNPSKSKPKSKSPLLPHISLCKTPSEAPALPESQPKSSHAPSSMFSAFSRSLSSRAKLHMSASGSGSSSRSSHDSHSGNSAAHGKEGSNSGGTRSSYRLQASVADSPSWYDEIGSRHGA
ncbi:hypothetical protein DFH11DRAFT_1578576 [Phellopilus nigrolimitatus]|nr:hypothetical protein DFH11DRAFT_1578576 [Phellopilus nigrolimitatus]